MYVLPLSITHETRYLATRHTRATGIQRKNTTYESIEREFVRWNACSPRDLWAAARFRFPVGARKPTRLIWIRAGRIGSSSQLDADNSCRGPGDGYTQSTQGSWAWTIQTVRGAVHSPENARRGS